MNHGGVHGKMARYAARLNAFKSSGQVNVTKGLEMLLANAARVGGLDATDLNYPDHFQEDAPVKIGEMLSACSLELNGIAMRYGGWREFRPGGFTNPDASLRRKAVDLTKHAADLLAELNGSVLTLWMGQDGFDYSFQADYGQLWEWTIEALEEVCDHNPQLDVSIEYKPNEPRAHSLMPDVSTTLLALKEVNRSNLGVTLDFAHLLYAGEMPAHSAMLVDRYSRLLGVHLNDGYGKRDDGLMVGSVHPIQTVELFVALARVGYGGVIYFDTFPDHSGLDPVAECRANIANSERLLAVADRLRDDHELASAIERQDAAASHGIVSEALHAGLPD